MQVQIPDDSDFLSFRDQCLGTDGWLSHYSKKGVTVWCPREAEQSGGVQKVKVSARMVCLISWEDSGFSSRDPGGSAASHELELVNEGKR